MSSPTDLGRLDTAAWERLQDLADRLEALWREQGQVDLHVLLPPPGDPLRLACLAELIKTDLEIRWRSNHGVRLDWYVERFEELGAVSELSARLIYEEYRARQRFGDKPDLASYKRRFPRQFPEVEKLAQTEPIGTVAPAVPTPASPPPKPPPPMSSNVVVVSEGYKLLARIGAGSFGEVWRAEAPGGIFVAVKKIYRPVGSDADQHEKKALDHIKNLRHPFLLATHAYWISADGYLHIAMELADRTLRDRMRECLKRGMPGIPPAELLRLMNQAAQALDYVHSQGLFHRDIKPDNILLKNGFAMVGDFGLVRKEATLSMGSAGAGTLPYMGPEVFLGNVCKYSDQYSLAITYVELRSGGQRPFPPPANEFQAMMAAREGAPNVNMLEPAEQPILLRALAKNPEERFPTCVEFVEALETALRGAAPADAPALPNSWLQPMRRIGPEGYQLLHRLAGSSTVGQFWEAVAPGGKHVALKVIENLDHGGVLKYLRAYDLARCFVGAANVVQVLDRWLADGAGQVRSLADVLKLTPDERVTLIMVMELADGDLAHRLIGSGRKVSEERLPQLLDYLQQVAQALDHLNTRCHTYARRQVAIRHCGIHPENLLLVGDTVRIADFTLAQDATEPSEPLRADNLDLEPGYAAPELLEPGGGRVTEFSDQYSLAMTYAKLRTGSLPFDQSQSRNRVIDDQLEGKLNLQTLHAPERAVVARATARRPEDRYPSCAAFIEALAEACKPPRRATEPKAAASPIEETLEKRPATQRQVFDKPTPAHGIRRKWQGGEDDGGTLIPRQEETASHFQLHVPRPEVKTEEEQAWPRPMPASTSRRSQGLVIAVIVTLAAVLVVAGVYWKTRPSENQQSQVPPPVIPPVPPTNDSTKHKDSQKQDEKKAPPPEPFVEPEKVDKFEVVLSNVRKSIPELGGKARPFVPFLHELRTATKELGNKPPTLVSVCMAECVLETLDPSKDPRPQLEETRKLLSGRADLPAEFQAYGAYVQALLDSLENRWEDAIPRLPQPEARPEWFNEHRRGKAADLCYKAAAHFATKGDWGKALAAQQQAIEMSDMKQPPDCYARLTEYALGANKYTAAANAANHHLRNARIALLDDKDEATLQSEDFHVAVWGAEAFAKDGKLAEAVPWFNALAERYLRDGINGPKPREILTKVIDPGIAAATMWKRERAEDLIRSGGLARLYAAKGRIFYVNQFSREFPNARQEARQAFALASASYPDDCKDRFLAECRLWEGYLSSWRVEELRKHAELAKKASPEFSGACFLSGLAKHQEAAGKFTDVIVVQSLEQEAVRNLDEAIGKVKHEPHQDFLDLYYATRSAARLIQADFLFQQYHEKKLDEYRKGLEGALEDADQALQCRSRLTTWYPHLQKAHALEDLAWRCDPENKKIARFEEADREFLQAIMESHNLELQPIVGRGRALYRRVKYGHDTVAQLEKAEKVLTEVARHPKTAADSGLIGEANLWLALVCLELGGKEQRETALRSIAHAVDACDESTARLVLADVMDASLKTAEKLKHGSPAAKEFLETLRRQVEILGQKWPNQRGAAALATVRCLKGQGQTEHAIEICRSTLEGNVVLSDAQRVALLHHKFNLIKTKPPKNLDELINEADKAQLLAAKLEPQLNAWAKYWQALWRVYRFKAARGNENSTDLADALRLLQEAIEAGPPRANLPDWYLDAASICIALEKENSAVEYAKKVMAIDEAIEEQRQTAQAIVNKYAQKR
jgi:serine/threonine protein kinase